MADQTLRRQQGRYTSGGVGTLAHQPRRRAIGEQLLAPPHLLIALTDLDHSMEGCRGSKQQAKAKWSFDASSGKSLMPIRFNYDEDSGEFLCRAVNLMIALNDCPLHGGNTAIVVRLPFFSSCCAQSRIIFEHLCCCSPGPIKAISAILPNMMSKATRRTCGTATPTTNDGTTRPYEKVGIWTAYQGWWR